VVRWQPRQDLVVAVSYVVGLYMSAVDSTIIFTALPSLARGFHEPLASAQWVTLGYLLSLAVLVPSSGWIGDRFGTRRTYLLALLLFTGASAACGLSGSLTELVIFRVIQGAGGGLIVPVGQAMLFRTFPPERRAKAAGMVALGSTLGPATGPVLGGVLTTELSWRWCFFVNVPLGAIVLVIGLLFLGEHREPAAGRLDIPGFLLAGSGLALFLYAVSESSQLGWSSPVIIGTVGIGGLLGWSWLLPPYQWAFGAVCVTQVRAIEFRAPAVRDRCAADPDLGHELTQRMFQVLAGRLRDTRARLIARSVEASS